MWERIILSSDLKITHTATNIDQLLMSNTECHMTMH